MHIYSAVAREEFVSMTSLLSVLSAKCVKVTLIHISEPKKNLVHFLFLSELRQISINFNKFWYVDGKVAQIVCYIYISHLTWPTSPHYLVKRGSSNFFYLTLNLFQSDCSDLVSQSRQQKPLPDMQSLSEDDFCVSTGRHPSPSRTQHCRFPGARERRERCVVV